MGNSQTKDRLKQFSDPSAGLPVRIKVIGARHLPRAGALVKLGREENAWEYQGSRNPYVEISLSVQSKPTQTLKSEVMPDGSHITWNEDFYFIVPKTQGARAYLGNETLPSTAVSQSGSGTATHQSASKSDAEVVFTIKDNNRVLSDEVLAVSDSFDIAKLLSRHGTGAEKEIWLPLHKPKQSATADTAPFEGKEFAGEIGFSFVQCYRCYVGIEKVTGVEISIDKQKQKRFYGYSVVTMVGTKQREKVATWKCPSPAGATGPSITEISFIGTGGNEGLLLVPYNTRTSIEMQLWSDKTIGIDRCRGWHSFAAPAVPGNAKHELKLPLMAASGRVDFGYQNSSTGAGGTMVLHGYLRFDGNAPTAATQHRSLLGAPVPTPSSTHTVHTPQPATMQPHAASSGFQDAPQSVAFDCRVLGIADSKDVPGHGSAAGNSGGDGGLLGSIKSKAYHTYRSVTGTLGMYVQLQHRSGDGPFNTRHIKDTPWPVWRELFHFVAPPQSLVGMKALTPLQPSSGPSFAASSPPVHDKPGVLHVTLWHNKTDEKVCLGTTSSDVYALPLHAGAPLQLHLTDHARALVPGGDNSSGVAPGAPDSSQQQNQSGLGTLNLRLYRHYYIKVIIHSVFVVESQDMNRLCDPYFVLRLRGEEIRSRIIWKCRECTLGDVYYFSVPIETPDSDMILSVALYDCDVLVAGEPRAKDWIGSADLDLSHLTPLQPKHFGLPIGTRGRVQMEVISQARVLDNQAHSQELEDARLKAQQAAQQAIELKEMLEKMEEDKKKEELALQQQDQADQQAAEAERRRHEEQQKLLEQRIAALKAQQVAIEAKAAEEKKKADAALKAALEDAAKVQQASGARMTPPYWTNTDPSVGLQRIELTNDPKWVQRFQTLLDDTCRRNTLGQGRDQIIKSGKYDRLLFHRAWRLENPRLYTLYAAHRDTQMSNPPEPIAAKTMDLSSSKWLTEECGLRRDDRNECMLWHGTKPQIVDIICNEGFDERVCSLTGLFGAGVYLAEEVSKSDQYVTPSPPNDPKNGVYNIFLVRGAMGRYQNQKTATHNARRAPPGYDSILGQVDKNKYREFVLYDGWLAYPEFLIEYKRHYL